MCADDVELSEGSTNGPVRSEFSTGGWGGVGRRCWRRVNSSVEASVWEQHTVAIFMAEVTSWEVERLPPQPRWKDNTRMNIRGRGLDSRGLDADIYQLEYFVCNFFVLIFS